VPGGGRAGLSSTRHLQLAEDNERAFLQLRATAPPAFEWAGTALFYSAVHFADSLLRERGEPQAANHDERWRQLARHVDDEFLAHYSALKDLSQDWRYYGKTSTSTQLDFAFAGHHQALSRAVRAALKR
jgi:hypothetical protein